MTLAAESRPTDAEPADPQSDQPSAPGDPNAEPSPAAPSGESAPTSEASAQASALEAEVARLSASIEKVEKERIPGFQRKVADLEAQRDRALTDATQHRSAMLEWTRQTMLRNGLQEEWTEIERREQERTGRVLETQAGRAETMEVINDLLDSDDTTERSFGRFLRTQVKAGTEGNVPVRVTKQNLPTYRQMYDAGRGAPTATPLAPLTPVAAVAAVPRAQTPTPPRTIAPSGAPQTAGEPAYKKGDTPRSLLQRAFALKDRGSDAEA